MYHSQEKITSAQKLIAGLLPFFKKDQNIHRDRIYSYKQSKSRSTKSELFQLDTGYMLGYVRHGVDILIQV